MQYKVDSTDFLQYDLYNIYLNSTSWNFGEQ
jgi:hypothetical protein